jgi:hypothetical protein
MSDERVILNTIVDLPRAPSGNHLSLVVFEPQA